MNQLIRRQRAVHLTSVHPRYDTRIFIKQCRSLAGHGYEVTLVVADGNGDEFKDGVRIVDVGKPFGRLDRVLGITRRVFRKAIEQDADIYHLHDPELLPAGLRLKRLGRLVVFDSHEDVPRQILGKSYLPPVVRGMLSRWMDRYERHACPRMDGIIAATPFIRDKFLGMHARTVDINNFPILGELDVPVPWTQKQTEVSYIGGLGAIRGVREIVRAGELLRSYARINLAGRFSERDVEREVKAKPGWSRVNELGFLDRQGVRDVLRRSVAGLVTLHPIINYLDALPVKMFEYMAVGIPVIASDFPLWRKIIESNKCGLLINPLNPSAIAEAIDYLVTHPENAQLMGANGHKAVVQLYNWQIEEEKLFAFYEQLLSSKGLSEKPLAPSCRKVLPMGRRACDKATHG